MTSIAALLCLLALAPPVDPGTTPETLALFARLDELRRDYLLFGHQHTTQYGLGWTAVDTEDSDVKRATGAFPAVYGWDFLEPEKTATERGENSLHAHVLAAHARGGINTFCWHAYNPVTGGNFYDTTPAVSAILPGGAKHEAFKDSLDIIADFFLALLAKEGALIPVIFRPWHEHTGDWFWWGTPRHCSEEEFATLWRFTVDYLRREKGVHNLLYAWSPSSMHADRYFSGYPGDDYVDVFGLDVYARSLTPEIPRIRQLVERAEARGKVPALTEAGYPDGMSTCTGHYPYTKALLAPVRGDAVARRVAYVLVWRNATEHHYWVPAPGTPFIDDFRAFFADPFTVFGDRLPGLKPLSDESEVAPPRVP